MTNLKLKITGSKVGRMGFTLIELLIAISILSLSLLATFSAISNNIKGANFSSDEVTAYYLADEGIEYVRNLRDQNAIGNIHAFGTGGTAVPWLSGIANSSSDPCFNKVCVADSPNNTLASCSGAASTCPYLKTDPATGLYGYTFSVTTQFQRSITVTITSATEATVASTVTWTTNAVSKSYTVSEIMRAWQ